MRGVHANYESSAVDMAELRLAPGRHRASQGCPWIFRGELLRHEVPGGAVVRVVDATGRFVGRGIYSDRSQIAVRLMTTERTTPVTVELAQQRLEEAVAWRARLYPDRDSLRLVNSEGDGLPGLVVDRYDTQLVVEVTTQTMAVWLPALVNTLVARLTPTAVFERGRLSVRGHEGLPQEDRVVMGDPAPLVYVHEHGVIYGVDVVGGQKTGHFLDQYENRAAAARFAAGGRVLDVFSHTGGFGLTALSLGATAVVAVDSDAHSLEQARANAQRSGFGDRYETVAQNAFDWLRQASEGGPQYEQVVLDPPAFTRSAKAVAGALRGYREINLRALKLVKPGGTLVTSSCSYHVDRAQFLEVVGEAAQDAHRRVRVLEVRGASPDHPSHPLLPESRYLKCVILEVQ
ncbi:MAG: class I SAM-dependent rRNA methyltransferase [Thermaerobacter sp.]|nr:class I SAM-dependent rRNA methyltransferase [Thermaerobacter sp.]